ncbi:MAG: hypothetical protein JRJ12_11490 [Deltaproteobacteria bacterium]|nr:hypothetical protein [Deltaproteobacteria bacterium]MBW2071683.1 hypothetical protein [Deltaproteobacteria bacterium]
MKQYVIDQLRESDFHALENHLDHHAEQGDLPGIYWVPIPELLYEAVQREHSSCQPFYFAINLHRNSISFELLVRTRQRLRCSCIQYASQRQRQHIMDYADDLFDELNLKT